MRAKQKPAYTGGRKQENDVYGYRIDPEIGGFVVREGAVCMTPVLTLQEARAALKYYNSKRALPRADDSEAVILDGGTEILGYEE